MHSKQAHTRIVRQGHSADVVWTRMIAGLAIGLLVLVVLMMLAVAWAFDIAFIGRILTDSGQKWQTQNRVPGVQPNQAYERQMLQEEEQAILSRYAWDDEAHQFATIPIERSIELMATRNLQIEWPTGQSSELSQEETK